MTDRPFSAETAAAVQRYLGAFLSGSSASDAIHDVVTDVKYWGDSDHLEVLRIAHGVLGVHARIAVDVEFLTLVQDLGLTVPEAVGVMELSEPPAGLEDLVTAAPEPAPAVMEPAPAAPPASFVEPEPAAVEPATADDEPAPDVIETVAPDDESSDVAPPDVPTPATTTPDEAASGSSRVVSFDTSIDEEVALVDKAKLPPPTEKEGRRSRRERRRQAANEAEEHARRAIEAAEAERLARSQASPVSADVTIVTPGGVPAPDPDASVPGQSHVRVHEAVPAEHVPDEPPAIRLDEAPAIREEQDVAGRDDDVESDTGGAEPLFVADEVDGSSQDRDDAPDQAEVTVAPATAIDDDSDVVGATSPESEGDAIDLDAPPPLGTGVALMAVAGAAAVTATALLLFF